jgi:DNA-binding NtrC family response regulator
MAQILIIEDEVLLAKSLSRALTMNGHECAIAATAEQGLTMLQQMPTDLVLLDIQLPGMSGLDAIKRIRELDNNTSVMITTAFGTMAAAVEALRSGACDFLRKPLDTEEVLLAVERAVTDARLRHTVSLYHDVEAGKTDEDTLIAESAAMQPVLTILNQLSSMRLQSASEYPPVLILGETGTGKDLVARKIHFHGALSAEPIFEVNCTTLPRGLEEAELFGYEKGAFTGAERSKRGMFEAADGGTIFLNEIGDLSLDVQVKLLQVIEAKSIRRVGGLRDIPVNVRIIAATNRNLRDSSIFREDLFYRLNNVTIEMPPLRERTEDTIPLARQFLSRFTRKYSRAKTLLPEAEKALQAYNWPGNARELRQLLERVTFLSQGRHITADQLGLQLDIEPSVQIQSSSDIEVNFPANGIDIEYVEKTLLQKALEASDGNVSEAARKVRLGREAMRYRLKKHNLD